MDDARQIIELISLLGSVLVSIYGAIQSIRQRRAADGALAAVVGPEAVQYSKTAADITTAAQTHHLA